MRLQVMVAIDDSGSMRENGAGRMALEALVLLCKALTQLEVRLPSHSHTHTHSCKSVTHSNILVILRSVQIGGRLGCGELW